VKGVSKTIVRDLPMRCQGRYYLALLVGISQAIEDQSAKVSVNVVVMAEDRIDIFGIASQTLHIGASHVRDDNGGKAESQIAKYDDDQNRPQEGNSSLPADVFDQFTSLR
jgi:hypothetical protein